MIEIRQSRYWSNYLQLLGWKTEKIDSVLVYIHPVGFLGSVIKISRPSHLPPIQNLKKLIKFYKARQITIEPGLEFKDFDKLENIGFKRSKWSISPTKTILINLNDPNLLSKMHSKTRYNIRLSQKQHLITEIDNNCFPTFKQLWLESMRRKGYFWISTKELESFYLAFFNLTTIILIKNTNGESLAGVLLTILGDCAHYMFAASSRDGNKLFAPTLAVWASMMYAKKKGANFFDFEGIYDQRFHKTTRAWLGFTKFKSGFGGEVIEYPPPYVKFNPSLLRIINEIIL